MNIFNHKFDFNEEQDSTPLNDTGSISDPFNDKLTILLNNYVFNKSLNIKKVKLSSLKVEPDGSRIYIGDSDSYVSRNLNNISNCPVFLISLYCFYNFHLLFDEEDYNEEDIDNNLNYDENSRFDSKNGIELIINLISSYGISDAKPYFAETDNKLMEHYDRKYILADNLRAEIELLSNEIQPDEILFPWISILKESVPSKRNLNANENQVVENIVLLAKCLLQDLIYLKIVAHDSSKPGLSSFLEQFESFYMNEFILKLVHINKIKLNKLSTEQWSSNEIKSSASTTQEDHSLRATSPKVQSTIGADLIKENIENSSSAEPIYEIDSAKIGSAEMDLQQNTSHKSPQVTADDSFQKIILQELEIIKQTMLQEFQNIKFQYSLQQQHLIRLEQQIQLQPVNSNALTTSNNNNSFVTSGKFSPFINNSPSLNHILSANPPNNTNTTLQMLKSATQPQHFNQNSALPHHFIQNGQKSNANSPGGLALLSKIASPQPPMTTSGITSMIPHSNTNSNMQQRNNSGDKLPPLHESIKMQPTFSEIISDLSNPTPSGSRKPVTHGMNENTILKKRKLNPVSADTSNGLSLDINSMIQMGIEDSPIAEQQISNRLIRAKSEDANDEDTDANSRKDNYMIENGNYVAKSSNSPLESERAAYLHKEPQVNHSINQKKPSGFESVKYKIYRGHKTVFDVCEEWYVGIPRDKVVNPEGGTVEQKGHDSNDINDDTGKMKNFNNKFLFAVVNKSDTDNKNNAIIQRCKETTDGITRLESIQRLIQLYGWRRWKVTGDSHFFPKRRVVIDYIEDETNTGFKNGRFNIHLDTLQNCRKFVIWDLEQFRILNEMSLNNVSILLKNVKKLRSKKVTDGIKKEEETGGEEVYAALRREILGHNNEDAYFSIYSSAENVAAGEELVMAVDGYKPVRKLTPQFIEKFCKVNLFCKQ